MPSSSPAQARRSAKTQAVRRTDSPSVKPSSRRVSRAGMVQDIVDAFPDWVVHETELPNSRKRKVEEVEEEEEAWSEVVSGSMTDPYLEIRRVCSSEKVSVKVNPVSPPTQPWHVPGAEVSIQVKIDGNWLYLTADASALLESPDATMMSIEITPDRARLYKNDGGPIAGLLLDLKNGCLKDRTQGVKVPVTVHVNDCVVSYVQTAAGRPLMTYLLKDVEVNADGSVEAKRACVFLKDAFLFKKVTASAADDIQGASLGKISCNSLYDVEAHLDDPPFAAHIGEVRVLVGARPLPRCKAYQQASRLMGEVKNFATLHAKGPKFPDAGWDKLLLKLPECRCRTCEPFIHEQDPCFNTVLFPRKLSEVESAHQPFRCSSFLTTYHGASVPVAAHVLATGQMLAQKDVVAHDLSETEKHHIKDGTCMLEPAAHGRFFNVWDIKARSSEAARRWPDSLHGSETKVEGAKVFEPQRLRFSAPSFKYANRYAKAYRCGNLFKPVSCTAIGDGRIRWAIGEGPKPKVGSVLTDSAGKLYACSRRDGVSFETDGKPPETVSSLTDNNAFVVMKLKSRLDDSEFLGGTLSDKRTRVESDTRYDPLWHNNVLELFTRHVAGPASILTGVVIKIMY